MKSDIITSILIIIIFVMIFSWINYFVMNAEFQLDINELSIIYYPETRINGKQMLSVELGKEHWDIICYKREVSEDGKTKTLYLRPVKRYYMASANFDSATIVIDEDVDKIYLEDKKNNIREIWNKDASFNSYTLKANEKI